MLAQVRVAAVSNLVWIINHAALPLMRKATANADSSLHRQHILCTQANKQKQSHRMQRKCLALQAQPASIPAASKSFLLRT